MVQGDRVGKALTDAPHVVGIDDTTEFVVDLRPEPHHVGRPPHVPGTYERFVKPPMDRISGMVFGVLLLPILIPLMLGTWLTMGRPAIFTQKRVGRHGKPFTVYKLRTMRHDRRQEQVPFDGEDRRRVHKSHNDPRVTQYGQFLRKWSLDETPQFLNVALGHMSLVGPRPELVEIVEMKYGGWQHQRHQVKPGLTGIWQISDQRQELMYQATHIDVMYLDRISFREDMRILLLTVPAALGYRKNGF